MVAFWLVPAIGFLVSVPMVGVWPALACAAACVTKESGIWLRWVEYGARVGDPEPATNADVFPLRPGGARIPPGPNGPWFSCVQLKEANALPLLTGSENPVEFKVLRGGRPPFVVAVNGVVARLTTSLSGFRPKET